MDKEIESAEEDMRDLNYELKQLCERNRDGSHATQRDRARVLDLIASQLQELGFRQMVVAGLKPKHVVALVERWTAEGLAIGTIKNRMAELRWWAEKIGKQICLPMGWSTPSRTIRMTSRTMTGRRSSRRWGAG